MDYSQMSMLETAFSILSLRNEKMKMTDLIAETLAAKEITDVDNENATQLYVDITTSSKFVFMGDGEWDLKDRQSLKEYDKDGADFIDLSAVEEDEEQEEFTNFDEDEADEVDELDSFDEFDADEDENSEEDEDDLDEFEHDDEGNILERYEESDSFDEDEYNDYMDDFEDMYDDN